MNYRDLNQDLDKGLADLSRLADVSVEMRPYASESSDSDENDPYSAEDARKLHLLAAVDRTEELKDYVLTTMRQLARMSTGLSMLLPSSSYKQATHASLGADAPQGADLMGRVWHGLHKVGASVNHLSTKLFGQDLTVDALDLTLLPPDPTMALEAIQAKLKSLQRKLTVHEDQVAAASKPLFEAAYQQGEGQARENAELVVACWKQRAKELKTRVKAAMQVSPTVDPSVLEDVVDFLGSIQVINLPTDQAASTTTHRIKSVEALVEKLQRALPPPPPPQPQPEPVPVHPRVASIRRRASVPPSPPSSEVKPEPKKRPLPTKEPSAAPPTMLQEKKRRPSTSPYASLSKERPVKIKEPSPASPATSYASPKRSRKSNASKAVQPEEEAAVEVTAAATPVAAVDANVAAEDPTAAPIVGCEKCHMNNNHDKILLCDNNCGREYHMYCLKPPLEVVPEEDWFCPECVKVLCLAQKCQRFCVFNMKYCPRHLCKEPTGCPFRSKKQGYCGKHAKIYFPDPSIDDDDDMFEDTDKGKWQ
ncbi:unnamed protein product [Aphanomyces euteiches]